MDYRLQTDVLLPPERNCSDVIFCQFNWHWCESSVCNLCLEFRLLIILYKINKYIDSVKYVFITNKKFFFVFNSFSLKVYKGILYIILFDWEIVSALFHPLKTRCEDGPKTSKCTQEKLKRMDDKLFYKKVYIYVLCCVVYT